MKLFFSSLILSLLVLSGCGNNPQPAKQTKPLWTNNSEGAIGVCDSHISGNAAQEQAAMDRALQKLAKQQAVSVKTSSVSAQRENGGMYSSGFDSRTEINANTKLNAHIKKSWRNPKNNRYFVWMELD